MHHLARITYLFPLIVLLSVASTATPANAQTEVDTTGVGVVEGDERFLRENRDPAAFVGGSRDSQEGFVGNTQAIGAGDVQAATETLQEFNDRSGQLNRPLPLLRAGEMYYPRLVIGFPVNNASSHSHDSMFVQERDAILESRLTRIAGGPVNFSRSANRAVLRGTVASRELAEKLQIIASFDPDVDSVENQLQYFAP